MWRLSFKEALARPAGMSRADLVSGLPAGARRIRTTCALTCSRTCALMRSPEWRPTASGFTARACQVLLPANADTPRGGGLDRSVISQRTGRWNRSAPIT